MSTDGGVKAETVCLGYNCLSYLSPTISWRRLIALLFLLKANKLEIYCAPISFITYPAYQTPSKWVLAVFWGSSPSASVSCAVVPTITGNLGKNIINFLKSQKEEA